LIPAGAFDEGTKSVLVNAAYFKGSWMSQFKAEDTKKDNFYVTREKVAEFMSIKIFVLVRKKVA
jgi:serine protease inhibitor